MATAVVVSGYLALAVCAAQRASEQACRTSTRISTGQGAVRGLVRSDGGMPAALGAPAPGHRREGRKRGPELQGALKDTEKARARQSTHTGSCLPRFPLTPQAIRALGVSVRSWTELVAAGRDSDVFPVRPEPSDLCTIMYTSGRSAGGQGAGGRGCVLAAHLLPAARGASALRYA